MSDFLFAQPSFWSGAARVLDMGATFDQYNESQTTKDADALALYNDFRAVGRDLEAATARVAEEVPAAKR